MKELLRYDRYYYSFDHSTSDLLNRMAVSQISIPTPIQANAYTRPHCPRFILQPTTNNHSLQALESDQFSQQSDFKVELPSYY